MLRLNFGVRPFLILLCFAGVTAVITDALTNFTTMSYDLAGRLLASSDALNHSTTYTYDAGDNLLALQAPLGVSTFYSYDNVGILLSTTDAEDRVTTYAYNGRNEQTSVTNPLSGSQTFVYDAVGNMISATDENGKTTSFGYDGLNRLVTTTNALGGTIVYTYDPMGNRLSESDLNGNLTRYVYDDNDRRVDTIYADGTVRQASFDAADNMLTVTDAEGRTVSYSYDELNRTLSRTDSLTNTNGGSTSYSYDAVGNQISMTDAEGRTTTYAYDALNRLEQVTNPLSGTTSLAYDAVGNRVALTDANGRSATFIYDELYRLIGTTNPLSGTTSYSYDLVGNQTVITDTFGQVNLSLYDDFGRVVTRVVNYNGVTAINSLCTNWSNPDPEYNICSLTEYNEIGQVVATVNTIGQRNVTEFDELGRVVRTVSNWEDGVFDPNEPDQDIVSQKAYDAVGNTIILTDTMGNMTRHFYDDLNRGLGSVTNWTGIINSLADFASCYSLPENRDTDLCTMRQYDAVGNTIIMTDAAGRMTRTFYDELDRVQATVQNWNPATLSSPADCVIDPDNVSEENVCSLTGYDLFGRHYTSTNALGRSSLTVYDAQSRPFMQVQNWDGTPINDIGDCSFPPLEPDVNLCSVTFFDDQGRSYATQDPMGNRQETGYDALGRVVTSTRWLDDETPIISLTAYDARGNAYQRTDAENNTTTTTYDLLNRVKTTVSAAGVTLTRTYNALGQVVTTTNSLGYTTVKEYDGLGRVVKSWDGEQNLTQTIYDALGNRVGVLDPNGKRTTYLYDHLQRQVGLIQNDTGGSQTVDSNVLTQYQYDVMGNLQVVTSALGISSTLTLYDSLNRPWYTENAVGDGMTTQYDALGYRRVVTDGNGAVSTFAYDGLGRLQTTNYLNDGETITATYNAAGNRIGMSNGLGTIAYEYDSLGRMVVVTDTQNARVAYGYDKVGNRTNLTYPTGQVVTYTYTMDNQLDTVTDWDGGLTDYDYDGNGRLLTMTLPTGISSVGVYDGANRVTGLTHRNGSGDLLGQYRYELDGVGQPQVVTETLASPTLITVTEQFLESSGLLVVEAEAGEATAGAGQAWHTETTQPGYSGDSYIRALPDVGSVGAADEAATSPLMQFPVQVETAGSYAAWVRGYAANAAGDSLHLTLDGAVADSGARLTGFAPNSWQWSRLTMSDTNATLSFPSAGAYNLQLLMREDGLRVDKVLLITDTNYIPLGSGPAASAFELITDTVTGSLDTHVITYAYDDLYRLTEADYSGAITGRYQYAYNAVGSRMAYTATITSTVVTTYTYDAANQLETARSDDTGVIWHYVYDGNGQRVRQVPGGLTPAEGEVRYTFNQAGEMVRIENHNGNEYVVQADVGYDGLGNRVLGTTVVDGVPMTVTYTLDGFTGTPLMIANPVETTLILYGQYGIGEYRLNAPAGEQWHYYLGDGQLSVRQLTNGTGDVTLTRTYAPYGSVLAQAGNGSALFGYAGGQSGTNGLWYFGNGYFDPRTGQFLAATTRQDAVGLLAATVLANPAGMLMGPLLVWNGRRRKKGGRIPPGMLLLFGVILAVGLAGCDQDDAATPTIPGLPEDDGTVTVPGPDGSSAPATGTPSPGGGVTITVTPTCPPDTATPNPTPIEEPTSTSTSTPTVTPIPTPDLYPILPPLESPPSDLNQYTSEGTAAWKGLHDIQQKGGFWGNELDVREALILLINHEIAYQVQWQPGKDVIINQYDAWCSGGPWSGECVDRFWGYSVDIKQNDVYSDGRDRLPRIDQYVIPLAEGILNGTVTSENSTYMHYGNALKDRSAQLLFRDYSQDVYNYASYVVPTYCAGCAEDPENITGVWAVLTQDQMDRVNEPLQDWDYPEP